MNLPDGLKFENLKHLDEGAQVKVYVININSIILTIIK